jgi:DNA helicase-2/ATP-dependent DNA helicase PcrA
MTAGTSSSTAQCRVLGRLDDRNRVTEQQAQAATHPEDGFVAACPGSGKTRTVGLRLAYHAAFHPDLSIAAVSHTNTAVREIRAAAAELCFLPDHYFVGTLHAFLLRYVVYPFGHLRMKCSETPRVVGDERDWDHEGVPSIGMPNETQYRLHPWRFEIELVNGDSGRLVYRRPADWPAHLTSELICEKRGQWAEAEKERYWKRGLLSYADGPFIAYDVLADHPEVAVGVAARFDELIVDEVQDTSPLQLASLRVLREQDHRPGLVIVGDLCQSVYEWSGATPEKIQAFAQSQQLPDLPLTENFRSSQLICNVTHHFSTRPAPDQAAGQTAAETTHPELWTYKPRDLGTLVQRFRDRLTQEGIAEANATILAWTNSLVNRLNGRGSDDETQMRWLLRELGSAAAERDGPSGASAATFLRLDRALSYVALGSTQPVGLSSAQREEIRLASAELLAGLPVVAGDLQSWNLQARDELAQAAANISGAEPKNVNQLMVSQSAHSNVDAYDALAPPPAALARTIHDAKGETIEAVLVVARASDAETWATGTWLDKPSEHVDEVVRVAYVAFTRAARLLILAVPHSTDGAHRGTFIDVGFVES